MQLTNYQSCFLFKSKSFSLTVLQLLSEDLTLFEHHLTEAMSKTPNFFKNTPVVIDLEKINTGIVLDFRYLKLILHQHGMYLSAIQNATELQINAALKFGIGILNNRGKIISLKNTPILTKFIDQPVRSGMQIYAKDSDLIVTSQVSPGAEIMADGNIHIYGTLKGRALAGISGNKQVKIFCHRLDAELISIAGIYLTKEELHISKNDGMVQVFLQNEKLEIHSLY